MKKLLAYFAVGILFIGGLTYVASAAVKDHSATVALLIGTFANHLSLNPASALDLSEVSGAYCFNARLARGGLMLHWAIDPTTTHEDVITFYNAKPFIDAGLKVEKFPKFCGKVGCMEPNKWYFHPAREFEPHHGIKFPFPLIIKAMDTI
jgi:hypothetical protein